MKNTIKAKSKYIIKHFKNDEGYGVTPEVVVFDSEEPILKAEMRNWADYTDECENANNECAQKKKFFPLPTARNLFIGLIPKPAKTLLPRLSETIRGVGI